MTTVCNKHRTYSGEHKPRAECITCWRIYANVQADEVKRLNGELGKVMDIMHKFDLLMALSSTRRLGTKGLPL